MTDKSHRAGGLLEDFCRACKTDRMHTVIAADAGGRPLRVMCGYCRSEHNYRGGPKMTLEGAAADPGARRALRTSAPGAPEARLPSAERQTFPIVSDRERSAPPIMPSQDSVQDLEQLLRRIIREESGITPVAPAEKWRGGTLALRPGTPGLQERTWPIETFFHKIVMLRNRLRTIEQQVNASDLPEDAKLKLQAHLSGCYGTLTSFNVLFADEDDQFRGSGGGDQD